MKKVYENPVAEKIVFDYTNTVAASNTPGQKMFGTPEEPWCHGKEEPKPQPNMCGNLNNRCSIPN